MKIKITKEFPAPLPNISTYEVQVEFMHGDGDAYTSESFWKRDSSTSKEILEFLLDGLDYCAEWLEPKLQDIVVHLIDQGCEPDIAKEIAEDIMDKTPGDCTCDGEIKAAVREFTVYYYNELGQKFYCEIS